MRWIAMRGVVKTVGELPELVRRTLDRSRLGQAESLPMRALHLTRECWTRHVRLLRWRAETPRVPGAARWSVPAGGSL